MLFILLKHEKYILSTWIHKYKIIYDNYYENKENKILKENRGHNVCPHVLYPFTIFFDINLFSKNSYKAVKKRNGKN